MQGLGCLFPVGKVNKITIFKRPSMLQNLNNFLDLSGERIGTFLMKSDLPDFQIHYKPDFRQAIADSWPQSIEDKISTDCLYMDYQKAFDTVPHKRLLSKLNSYNINKDVLKWITEYLDKRLQFVEVNGKKSKWLQVTSGIPQGSVLGPLLFLVYINDLPDKINSTVYMYADDTKLYREIKTIEDNEKLQDDLDELKKWSDLWLLKFHPDKCFSITIGNKYEYDFEYCITVDNQTYEMSKVEEIKDIGVIIDSELKFGRHINSKIETANKILGIIRQSFMFLNCDIFIPLII